METKVFAAEGKRAGEEFNEYMAEFMKASDVFAFGEMTAINAAAAAFQTYYQHILDLAVDRYGIMQDDEPDGGQCAGCWCDSCAGLDVCTLYPATDGITPPPCAECGDIPLTPREQMPCPRYRPPDPPPEIGAEEMEQ